MGGEAAERMQNRPICTANSTRRIQEMEARIARVWVITSSGVTEILTGRPRSAAPPALLNATFNPLGPPLYAMRSVLVLAVPRLRWFR